MSEEDIKSVKRNIPTINKKQFEEINSYEMNKSKKPNSKHYDIIYKFDRSSFIKNTENNETENPYYRKNKKIIKNEEKLDKKARKEEKRKYFERISANSKNNKPPKKQFDGKTHPKYPNVDIITYKPFEDLLKDFKK